MWREVFTRDEGELLINLVRSNPALYSPEHPDYKNTALKAAIWESISEAVNKTEKECKFKWKYMRDYYIKRKREKRLPTEKDASVCHLLSFLSDPLETGPMAGNIPPETTNESNDGTSEEGDEASDDTTHEEEEASNRVKETPGDQIPRLRRRATAPTVTSTSRNSATSISRVSSRSRTLGRRKLVSCERATKKFRRQTKECNESTETIISGRSRSQLQPPSDPIDAYFSGILATVKNLPPLLQLEAKRDISNIVFNLEFRALQDQTTLPVASVPTASTDPTSPCDVSETPTYSLSNV
nr:PREDICTED: protein suppressor of variegation 3-7-like [Bemisia tabaci]